MTLTEAIQQLKMAVPMKAVTMAEFNDFIEAVNMAIDALENLPSAEPEIIHCKNCKHRESNDCPMYYEEWIEIDEGDGYFDTDTIIHDWTTDEGFCYCAELRGEKDEQSDLQTGCD